MKDKVKLFCFPFAGGNASFFDILDKALPELDLIGLEYSGHGTRRREPLYNEISEAAEDMLELLKRSAEGAPYALLGYSMGSIVLAEVLRRILRTPGLDDPIHVFIAAHEPVTNVEMSKIPEEDKDDYVIERTVRFGGISEEIAAKSVFKKLYAPLYRADYGMIEKYRFEELDLSTELPASVFYSEEDTPLEKMLLWKRYFTGECGFYRFDGDHFFLREERDRIAEIIRDKLS